MQRSLTLLFILLILLNMMGCMGARQMRHVGCYVADVNLQGIYHGQCNADNIAEGQGKAIGEDTYDGQFKAGLPSGQGIYIWRNGDRYIGLFQRGMANGRGVMLLMEKNCRVEGMWNNNQLKNKILSTCH